MTDTTEQRKLTLTEERMLRTARVFAAEGRLAEHGQPIRESQLIELVRRMSAIRQPTPRPKDREVYAQPRKRSGPPPVDKSPVALAPVLRCLERGLTDGQMALELGLSEDQVERRVRWLRSMYSVRSRRDVVEAARKAGDLPDAASTPVAAPGGPSVALKAPSGSTEPQAPSSASQAAVQAVQW
jgi:DNA-binding CsgD family transcriptional regulator